MAKSKDVTDTKNETIRKNVANKKENELKIYKNILEKSYTLKNKFEKFYITTIKNVEISDSMTDYNVVEMIKSLIFGVDDTNVAKVDIGKNRNLIKQMLLNLPSLYKVACLYKELLIQFEEYLNYIDSEIESIPIKEVQLLNEYTFEKFKDLVYSFSWEATYMRSHASTFKTLIYNSGSINFEKPHNINGQDEVVGAKKDTLKRYYFGDCYDIKNGFKYFDNSKMIFGETNAIMRVFNRISDYLFKDFITVYNTIVLNIEEILKHSGSTK